MEVYHYDSQTREYLGSSQANPDPLDRGRFATPAHATDMAPPTIPEGHAAVWNGESWQLVRDLRDKTVYSAEGEAVIVTHLGNLPDGFSENPPEPKTPTIADLLKQLRLMKQQYLEARYPRETIEWFLGHQIAGITKPDTVPQSHLAAIEQAWSFINNKVVNYFFAIGGQILSGELKSLDSVSFTTLDADDPSVTVSYVRGLP